MGKTSKLNKEDFIKKSCIIHDYKYDYSYVEYVNNRTKIKIICKEHGGFEQTPCNHLNGKGCRKCGYNIISNKNKLSNYDILNIESNFILNAKLLHDNKYNYSLVEYLSMTNKVKIICPLHGVFEQTPFNHLNSKGCKKCNMKFSSKEDFIIKAVSIYGDLYDYSLVNFNSVNDDILIICPIHGVFKQKVYSHLKGYKCYKCTRTIKKENSLFIEECKLVHNNKYDYVNTLYEGVNNKINIICPIHGEFLQRAGAHLSGHGCKLCKESKGELIIKDYLTKNNIEYIREKTFTDCKNYRLLYFDFYLPKYNLIIEFDGKQHFMPISVFGGHDGFEKIKTNDDIKNKYCEYNGINLLRISFKDKNIINILNDYFSFKT